MTSANRLSARAGKIAKESTMVAKSAAAHLHRPLTAWDGTVHRVNATSPIDWLETAGVYQNDGRSVEGARDHVTVAKLATACFRVL